MVDYCRRRGFVLRLIEQMPVGASAKTDVSSLRGIRQSLVETHGLVDAVVPGGGPARYLKSPDGAITVGFITPMSTAFLRYVQSLAAWRRRRLVYLPRCRRIGSARRPSARRGQQRGTPRDGGRGRLVAAGTSPIRWAAGSKHPDHGCHGRVTPLNHRRRLVSRLRASSPLNRRTLSCRKRGRPGPAR